LPFSGVIIATSQNSTAWIASLGDPGILADVEAVTAGGTLSYDGALQILRDVAARGAVTAAEFAALKTVAANLENGIVTSDYVASIFTQLVDGSQANAEWNGGSAVATPLGNLGAGTSAAQMNELIGKWFLGTDLPDPTVPAQDGEPTLHPVYGVYNDALFGTSGAPQIADVAQGVVGDCELCSGMIEAVANHPGLVQSMFVDDGNGTYGLRFYVNGKATWVTVNDQLPTYQHSLIFNNAYAADQSQGLWADLIEKAYAQLSSTGNIDHPAVNSYQNISADTAFDVLTNLTDASNILYLYSSSANWAAYKSIIINAVDAHQDVIVETGTNAAGTTDSAGNQLLIGDHAYAVMGYDAATGDFIIRNPWGATGANQGYITQFEVSMSDIAGQAGDVAIDNAAAPNVVIANSQGVASLATETSPSFNQTNSSMAAGAVVPVAAQIQASDTAGLAVAQYMVQLLGNGSIQLNGAVDQANSTEQAAGQMVVSAGDLSKLTMTAGSASGGLIELFVSGNDGTGWSTPLETVWSVDGTALTVLPAVDPLAAPSGAVPVASLFKTIGTATTYDVSIEAGGGSINLNGAVNLGTGATIVVSAGDLAKLTYTAPATPGVAILDVTAVNGQQASDVAQIPVDVGYGAAAALQTFNQGETPYQVTVADSAADIFANLDALETMMPSWSLLGVLVTDATAHTETVTAAQLTADRGVLSIIDGPYSLDVTGVASVAAAETLLATASDHVASVEIDDSSTDIFANLAALQALAVDGQLAGISLTDAAPVKLSLTVAAATANSAALGDISGNFTTVIADSAADVLAALPALQSLVAAGTVSAISLTDAGTPALAVSAAQLAADSAALKAIGGNFTLTVAAGSASAPISGLADHATTVQFSGDEAQYVITAANGTLTVNGAGLDDTLTNVSALQFADHTAIVAQAPGGGGGVTTGNITELYSAVLAREPDIAGLSFYQNYLQSNPATPLLQFADWFLSSSEYAKAHSYAASAAGDAQFIQDSYENLLHRAPTATEVSFYQANVMTPAEANLTPGTQAFAAAQFQAHAQMLVYFSGSAEFLADVQATAQNPASAQHWLILV